MIEFLQPMSGIIKEITEVPDEVFSSRMMGDGFAVELKGDRIIAPVSGTVTAIYPGGHAVCIQGDDGFDVMVHIGLDSYKVKGLCTVFCKQDQHIEAGELLVTCDAKQLKKKTGSALSPVVILSGQKIKLNKKDVLVKAGDTDFFSLIE